MSGSLTSPKRRDEPTHQFLRIEQWQLHGGFAWLRLCASSRAIRTHWVKLLGDYLQQRRQLIGLVLIMDARHPLKELDLRMLDFFHITGRPVHILLSKADKLSKNEQIKTLGAVKKRSSPI